MNIPKVINSQKLYDLYEQIFDYFSLTVYDLESKIDTNLNISNIKNKLETFSDRHFKNALNDFNNRDMEGVAEVMQKAITRAEQLDPGKESLFIIQDQEKMQLIHYKHDSEGANFIKMM